MDRWRDQEKPDDNIDALKFLASKAKSYPTLVLLARMLLHTPATSVPSESLFSQAGLVCTYLRNRLSPENLEIITYIKQNMEPPTMRN